MRRGVSGVERLDGVEVAGSTEGGVRPPLRRPWVSPRLLAAIAVPYGVLAFPSAWAAYALLSGAGAVIRDGELAVVGTGRVGAVLLAAVLTLAVPALLAPWAVLAGIGVAAAEGCSRAVTLRAAWRWAARRPASVARVGVVLLLGVAGAAAGAAVVALVTHRLLPEAPPVVVMAGVGIALLVLAGPYAAVLDRCVARILAPADPAPVGRRAVPPQLRGRPAQHVLVALIGWSVAQGGVRASGPEWFGWFGESVVAAGTLVLLGALVAALVGDVLALRRDGRPTVVLPAAARVPIPELDRVLWAGVVVAVLAGVAAVPLTAAQNPADLTRVRTMGDGEAQSPRADLVALGDHVVLWRDDPLWRSAVCGSRDCWYQPESGGDAPVGAAASPSGSSVWSAQWRFDPRQDRRSGEDVDLWLELTRTPTWAGADWTGRSPVTTRRVLTETTLGAVRGRAGEPLVAGSVEEDLRVGVATAPSGVVAVASSRQRGELLVAVCDDTALEGSTPCDTSTGDLPAWDQVVHAAPAVAVTDDGTAYVTAAHGSRHDGGDTASLHVAHGGVVTRQPIAESAGDPLDWTRPSSTAVAVGRTGNAWVLYRLRGERDATLVRCADRVCAESTSVAVPGVVSARGALAVDETGRPLVVTSDPDDGSLLLWSCRDTRCDRTETVTLAGPGTVAQDERSAPSLTLGDGRPIVLAPISGLGSATGTMLRCEDARCGAE